MEHLVGKDLCQHLHEEGQLPVRVAVEYVMQACEALAAAHSIGIVHRDVKPENLFLTERAQGMHIVKVLDFGISKVALTGSAFDHQPLARTMMPMGSPVYMSPEQIRATDEIDARTDIWSLGCVLYELLTGVPAFDAPSLTQLSATILEKDPVAMASLAPDVPPELEAIVLKCLEKNRDTRYRNIAELAIALYPFAPRRARISAERCASLLSESSHGALEFELPSVAPPAHPTLRGRMTSTNAGHGPTSTNSPTAVLVEDPEVRNPPFAPKKRGVWIGASLAIAAVAGAVFGAAHAPETTSTTAPAKPVAAAASPHVEAPKPAAPATEPSPTQPTAIAVAPSAPAGTTSALPSSAPAQKASVAVPQAHHAIFKPKREGTRPAKSGDDLDVGF
jgi:serine/threonine-protein kinase